MNGTARKPPDFALLIGKRLKDKKGGGDVSPPPDDSSYGDDAGDGQQKSMQLSAMKDFIAAVKAGSPEEACIALDQYNDLADTGGGDAGDDGGV